MKNTNNNRMWN